MPIAAIGAGLGAAGSAASAAGGKKAGNRANDLAQQQLDLQRQQFGLTQQQVGFGNKSISPAAAWYQDLLKGGPAAMQATGPYASLIGQAGAGARQAISSGTARGGEQNLALAQSYNQQANDISRLYAGMQPLAAQGLTDVARAYFGIGSALNPSANIGAGMSGYLGQLQAAQQGVQGFGSLLYNALKKFQGGGGGPAPAGGGSGGNLPPGSPTI